MTGCNLVGTAPETDLFHAVLSKMLREPASFEGADMRYVSLRQGQFMRRAKFRNANLEGANPDRQPVCGRLLRRGNGAEHRPET
jgi:uncharacterized protein YjbI with pentapeptide repeats